MTRELLRKTAYALVASGLLWTLPGAVLGQDQGAPDEFFRARVTDVLREEQRTDGPVQVTQALRLRILSGAEKGTDVETTYSALREDQKLHAGQTVIITKVQSDHTEYVVVDVYRLPALLAVGGVFFASAILFGKRRGATSLLGLLVSVLVLTVFIVPRIAAGHQPLLTSLLGATVIACVSLYLAHGFNRRTSVALGATLITLFLSVLLTLLFVSLTRLFGLGSDEAFYLQLNTAESINPRGLLLGGIIIGVLGVLDDITTSQAAVVEELQRANPQLTFSELYRRAISVGREHIAALVNTLALAYAGASLPLFLLFTVAVPKPLWVTLNSEIIAEELVRALIGSMTLMAAVPITTTLAVLVFGKDEERPPTRNPHSHTHAHGGTA